MQEAAQIVAGTALASNRILQNRLTQNVSGLEDLEARIVLFDRFLSPDEEDGKQLGGTGSASPRICSCRKATARSSCRRTARPGTDRQGPGVPTGSEDFRRDPHEHIRQHPFAPEDAHMYRGRNQTLGPDPRGRAEAIGAFLAPRSAAEIEKGS